MISLPELLLSCSSNAIPILDKDIPLDAYTALDLSTKNEDLEPYHITDPDECQTYIDIVLKQNNAQVAYGGYLERRNLYDDKAGFSGEAPRNIHLGVDFWAKAGTKVMVPLDGIVHSFKNNATIGNYGPTIVLEHQIEKLVFHTLYGHLSLASLDRLTIGKIFKQGDVLATLGTPDINVNYAPHLHFQLICDMQDKKGDYPGVCSEESVEFYSKNCPNPSFLLKMQTFF